MGRIILLDRVDPGNFILSEQVELRVKPILGTSSPSHPSSLMVQKPSPLPASLPATPTVKIFSSSLQVPGPVCIEGAAYKSAAIVLYTIPLASARRMEEMLLGTIVKATREGPGL